jgi:uncharacterized membrane protein
MAKITKKVSINSPVEKVFQFVTSPDNWTKYVTSLTNVRDITSANVEPGTTFSWEYRMLGMTFGGKGRITENVKNSKFGMKMEGGFPIQEDYTFTPLDGKGTELTVEISYDIPGRIMSTVSKSSVVEKLNQKEADGVLEKIKTFCEEL